MITLMRFRCLIVLGILALSLPLFSSQVIAATKTQLVLCGTTWGKLSGHDLPNKGFVPDLVMRVLRHAGYEVKYEITPWPRCVAGVKNLTYDILASAWHGKNFDADFDYMDDILIDTINFIVLKNSPISAGTMQSFYGHSVGIVRDVSGIEDIITGHDKIKVTRVASLDKLPRMLIGKRFTAIVSDPVSLNEVMKVQGLSAEHQLVALQPPLKMNIQAPLISKKHPNKDQIISDFNKSFRKLASKEFYDELIKLHDLQVQYPEPIASP